MLPYWVAMFSELLNRVRSATGIWRVGVIVLAAAVVGGAVGGVVGALVTSDPDPPASQLQLSVPERVAAINVLVDAQWPQVNRPADWYMDHQDAHASLGHAWLQPGGLGEFLHVDGLGSARGDVEVWRTRYADWAVETEELLQQLDHSDHHHAPLQTVHARGLRILVHVDAILSE